MNQLVIIGGYTENKKLLKPVASLIKEEAVIIGWPGYRRIVSKNKVLPKLSTNSTIIAHSAGVLLVNHWLKTTSKFIDKVILVSPVGHVKVKPAHGLARFMQKNVLLFKLLFSSSAKRGSFARNQMLKLYVGGLKEVFFHPIIFIKLVSILTQFNFNHLNLDVDIKVVHIDNDVLSPIHTLPKGVTILGDSEFGHDAFILDQKFISKIAELL